MRMSLFVFRKKQVFFYVFFSFFYLKVQLLAKSIDRTIQQIEIRIVAASTKQMIEEIGSFSIGAPPPLRLPKHSIRHF